jgi:TRAP-type mannitol/chloroaromatic compound transport system substrate-binding protein
MVAAGTAALALPLAKASAQTTPTPSMSQNVAACQSLIRRVKVLTMVTAWPKSLAPLHRAAELLAQRVEALSDGKLRVKLYAAGTLIPAAQNYDAARDGDVDLVHSFESYRAATRPGLHLFSSIPFGMTSLETQSWLLSEGQRFWDNLSKPTGLKPLWAGDLGPGTGLWTKKALPEGDRLSGWVVRSSGLARGIYERLGAEAVRLDDQALVSELGADNLDGAEWFGPWMDQELGLDKRLSHCYGPALTQPSQIISLLVNQNTWDKLDADHRAILGAAAQSAGHETWMLFETQNRIATARMAREGVEKKTFERDLANALGAAAGQVLEQTFASDGQAEQAFASYARFRQAALAMAETGSAAFQRARLLPFQFAKG